MTAITKKTIEIEDDLIAFVSRIANENRRSFTGQLNQILTNEKNRVEGRERKDKNG